MKKISKLLALVLALVMALALVSCGGVTVGGETGGNSTASTGGASTSTTGDASTGDASTSAPVDASGAQEGCNIDSDRRGSVRLQHRLCHHHLHRSLGRPREHRAAAYG